MDFFLPRLPSTRSFFNIFYRTFSPRKLENERIRNNVTPKRKIKLLLKTTKLIIVLKKTRQPIERNLNTGIDIYSKSFSQFLNLVSKSGGVYAVRRQIHLGSKNENELFVRVAALELHSFSRQTNDSYRFYFILLVMSWVLEAEKSFILFLYVVYRYIL